MKKSQRIIAGIDEAGRGCLAGPVIAGAVILVRPYPKALIQDSKILSEKKRQEAFHWIIKTCEYAYGEASAREIDEFGIKKATHLAMNRALSLLRKKPDHLLVDGRDHFVFQTSSEEFVRGDSLFPEIAAASIVAKVTRDQKMKLLAEKYPEFQFEKNKGYGVAHHMALIREKKLTPDHRKSFDPLRTLLEQKRLFS